MTTIFPPAPRHPSYPASGSLYDLPVLRDTADAKGLLLHLPIQRLTVVPDRRVENGWKATVTESHNNDYLPADTVTFADLEIETAIEVEGNAHEALVAAFRAPAPADARDMFEYATEFTFAPEGSRPTDQDFHLYLVKVQYRDGGWAVTNLGRSWNGSTWELETGWSVMTLERSWNGTGNEPDAANRFDRDTALRLARRLVETVRHNGLTWAELTAAR